MFDTPDHRSARISPLELLHPTGAVQRARVIGDGCPANLLPAAHTRSGAVDLCVMAPTSAQCREPGWLAQAGQLAADIAPEGVVYVLAPRRWRMAITRMLRARGLMLKLRVGHLPIDTPDRCLVPLLAAPAAHALAMLIPTNPLRRTLARWLLCLPGGDGIFATLLPWAGLIFQRTGSRPCFSWLAPCDETPTAVIRASHRAAHATAVLHVFLPKAARPSAVTKLSLTDASHNRIIAEASLMQYLTTSVARSRTTMAQVMLHATGDGRPVLWQTVLHGPPLAALLPRDPVRLRPSLQRIATWLERWSRDTAQTRSLDRAWLEHTLLGPLAELPALPNRELYRARLTAYCEQLAGNTVALVATHADLTMWNVLFNQGDLQIVDWEAAQLAALPLTDFMYAAVDAVDAASGYADRLAAFQACFCNNGAYVRLIAACLGRLCRAVGIDQGFAQLCFHACWLHHAAQERRERATSAAGGFEQIVAWLAQHPDYLLEVD